jgi:putative cell wall-binding protein
VVGDGVATALDAFTAGSVRRIAGVDRYATAADLSADAFPAGAPAVHVVSGAGFADAVAAGPAAAAAGGPILLVTDSTVPDVTASELARLAPTSIVVVGGTGTVGAVVEDGLARSAPVATITRIAGTDRYATAAALADLRLDTATDMIYVATGIGYADALVATPAAIRDDAQILLVPPTGAVPQGVRSLLDRAEDADLIVVGGAAAISVAMEDDLR